VKIMHPLTLSPILMKRMIDLIWRVAPGVQTEWLQCPTGDDALDALKRNRADIIIAPLETHSHDFVEYLHWFDDYRLVTGINDAPESMKRGDASRYLAYTHAGQAFLQTHSINQTLPAHKTVMGDVSAIIELVTAGGCCSILPSSILPLQEHKLRSVPLEPPCSRRIAVIAHSSSLLSGAARTTIECLKKCHLQPFFYTTAASGK
jgi:DNA-binding transcriptional LysR family regulator